MTKTAKDTKEHNIQIQVEVDFKRVLCNDVPVEYLQTLVF